MGYSLILVHFEIINPQKANRANGKKTEIWLIGLASLNTGFHGAETAKPTVLPAIGTKKIKI
ncbi:hypothetical protein MTBBW1_2210005 [Desulfamplus magnetovallimortis]|uniref:Uncharacterized protein n=1 Tax=Desulfamplus magnetovallimortis TaxID=1246637 RepID=A0A1W1HD24_9BACT|nr:hypothetical protein MTBBW1_2210005 [Desulfamplus magnetovallimortis]